MYDKSCVCLPYLLLDEFYFLISFSNLFFLWIGSDSMSVFLCLCCLMC